VQQISGFVNQISFLLRISRFNLTDDKAEVSSSILLFAD